MQFRYRSRTGKIQTLVNGQRVENANVLIEDALEMTSTVLEQLGWLYTMVLSASNFHLDFRGLAGE